MIFQQNLYVDLNLRKEDLAEYLLSHGWQQVDHPNEKMLVFDGLPDDEGTAIRVALPASENFRDYSHRVYEVVETIAGVEDREIIAVAEDIRKDQQASIDPIRSLEYVALKMLEYKFSLELIASCTGLSSECLQKLRSGIEQKRD
jgi:hypothetical protein